jgi:hypothetical protein
MPCLGIGRLVTGNKRKVVLQVVHPP